MADYKRAEDIIKAFAMWTEYAPEIEKIVKAIPSYDVVEVVRCTECTKRKKNKFCLEFMRYEKNEDGFCSYGEGIDNDIPSADVVEVVRCRNCEHYEDSYYCRSFDTLIDPNHYCGYGADMRGGGAK